MKDGALSWKRVASRSGPDLALFDVRIDTMQHPISDEVMDRVVLQTVDWVNVVAITREGRIVMVEQYRFGVSELTIEPVGGLIDAGEESLEAGRRELLEESGYGNGRWTSLGTVQANPAIHNNRCHHWLVEDVEFVQDPTPDAGEAIRVHLMTLEDVKAGIASGAIRHSLGLSALSRVFPLWPLPDVRVEI